MVGVVLQIVVRRVDPIESQRAPRTQSYSDLVRDLLNGDSSAIPRVDGGETAVGALIAEFPGPVCAPARPTTKASECGPILRIRSTRHQSEPIFDRAHCR